MKIFFQNHDFNQFFSSKKLHKCVKNNLVRMITLFLMFSYIDILFIKIYHFTHYLSHIYTLYDV